MKKYTLIVVGIVLVVLSIAGVSIIMASPTLNSTLSTPGLILSLLSIVGFIFGIIMITIGLIFYIFEDST
jgi:hypothetical protein